MPHLAPLSWLVAVFLFWGMIIIMMSIVWWVQLPYMSGGLSGLVASPFSSWKWK